jgi:hypothetical protein
MRVGEIIGTDPIKIFIGIEIHWAPEPGFLHALAKALDGEIGKVTRQVPMFV